MQLVAYGAQDIYLTGQPQITFFKSVYRRHTNFAMESIQQTIHGSPGIGTGITRVETTVNRNGDMIMGAHIELLPITTFAGAAVQDMWSYMNFYLFDRIEMEIGGQKVDTIYSDWMTLYAELVYRQGYDVTIQSGANAGEGSDTLGTTLNNSKALTSGGCITIPFLFYFHNNPGLAVPLIALQYHEVKFIMYLNITPIIDSGGGATTTGLISNLNLSLGAATGDVNTSVQAMKLYVDYGFLDTAERRKFAQNAHEYLITQHQRINRAATTTIQSLSLSSLNHPIKYVAWRFWPKADATPLACTTYDTAKITLNGSDRMSERPSNYYENAQVHEFWPCGGNQLSYATQSSALTGIEGGKWSVYSFALRPAEQQPSGTCNFSRIDNSQLEVTGITTSTNQFTLHAENYNVLRVMSGMGGLAYSN